MAQILVAEDEHDIRELINFTLMFGGHTVTTVANGEEAVQKAAEIKPDLIMMDIRMWDPLESTCRHASLSIL